MPVHGVRQVDMIYYCAYATCDTCDQTSVNGVHFACTPYPSYAMGLTGQQWQCHACKQAKTPLPNLWCCRISMMRDDRDCSVCGMYCGYTCKSQKTQGLERKHKECEGKDRELKRRCGCAWRVEEEPRCKLHENK